MMGDWMCGTTDEQRERTDGKEVLQADDLAAD